MAYMLNKGNRFRTGVTRKIDLCYVVMTAKDLVENSLPHSVVTIFYKKEWCNTYVLKWNSLSCCISKEPKPQCVYLGEYGNICIQGSGEFFEETITDSNRPNLSNFREVRCIGGYAYACGMDRQVYRRDAPGQWTCVDQDIGKLPAADEYVFGFESIHGFDQNDIYAVGWHGEIWHFDGTRWKQIDSPVNALLNRVYCAPDGQVYVCGHGGLLLRGCGEAWEIIDHQSTTEDLWDLEWFGGKLYLSSLSTLFTLEVDRLELVETGDEVASSCYHLDAADGIMWSIGAEDILQFDGTTWARIE
jgi:hypothetical protein